MSVDLKQDGAGRSHFVLGPVERWIVVSVAAGLVGSLGWFANKVDKQGEQNGDDAGEANCRTTGGTFCLADL